MKNKLKILLLEDDIADAELIQKKIALAGIKFETVIADDKCSYINALNNCKFDIILSDNSIGAFSGKEALNIHLASKNAVPFILVTGTMSEEFAVEIIKEGADDYILKTNLSRLPAAILNAIEKQKMIAAKYEADIELRNSREKLRQLTAYLQRIREEERSDIAREIHDELGQQLTALKIDIGLIKNELPATDFVLRGKITNCTALVDTTIKTVRKIASRLRPAILDSFGIEAALEWQASEFESRTNIKCHFEKQDCNSYLSKDAKIALFRIYQESLTNIARYSKATAIFSYIQLKGNMIELSITDNGIGFDVKAIQQKNTLGLVGMKERAEILKGKLTINSKPNAGTTITVSVPIEKIHIKKVA